MPSNPDTEADNGRATNGGNGGGPTASAKSVADIQPPTGLPQSYQAMTVGGEVVPIIPQSIDEVWKLAKIAVVGKMAPQSLVEGKEIDEQVAACAVAIMAGAEVGLTPLMSLRSFAVINGRPSLWGDGLIAVVRKSGKCADIDSGVRGEGNERIGYCKAERSDTGKKLERTFSWGQAVTAQLTNKPIWKQYPDRMLEKRAVSYCLRDLFADVLGGLTDELEARDSEPRLLNAPAVPVPPAPPAPGAVGAPGEPGTLTIEAEQGDPGGGLAGNAEAEPDWSKYLEDLETALTGARSLEDIDAVWDEFAVRETVEGYPDWQDTVAAMRTRYIIKLAPTSEPGAQEQDDVAGDVAGDAPSGSDADQARFREQLAEPLPKPPDPTLFSEEDER